MRSNPFVGGYWLTKFGRTVTTVIYRILLCLIYSSYRILLSIFLASFRPSVGWGAAYSSHSACAFYFSCTVFRAVSQLTECLEEGNFLCHKIKFHFITLWLLHQIEQKLMVQIGKWEEEHERSFLINGCHYLNIINNQWAAFNTQKEQEKVERVSHKHVT